MSKKEYKLNKFSGGISDDIRQPSENSYSLSQHFDITTSPYKLTPFRDSEADNTTQTGIINFAWDGDYLYGLGLTLSGGLKVQIYRKTTSDDISSAWGTPSTSTSAGVSHIIGNTFVIYKGYIYLFAVSNTFDRWQIGGTYTNTYQVSGGLAYTDGSALVTQGLVHSKTDTLYIGYSAGATTGTSALLSINGTVYTANAFSLPSNMIPTALAEFGSYLAIACRPVNESGTSKIFIWDMVSSTPTDVIDFGSGDLWCMANIGGHLIGIMNERNSPGITFTKSRVSIKRYSGGAVQLVKTLEDDGLILFGLLGYKPFITGLNSMSFGLYSTGSKVPTGIYTVSKSNENSPFVVTMERLIHNSTSITSFVGLLKVGDVMFTAYNYVADTSSSVGRTNDTALYTATSALDTQKFGTENTRQKKNWLGITVTHEALPSGASVVVKYKKDEETSYTTIFTNSTQNSLYHSSTTIESAGAKLPDFREIQFRIESTGGAVITGIFARVEDKNDDIYE